VPDFTKPDHLPHRRSDGRPPHPTWLPRQQRGTTPQMIGRYPRHDVFDAIDTWDPATRRVIEERMRLSGAPLVFFAAEEQPTLRAFCDTCLAQDTEPRVPVAEFVDEKLAAGRLDGYRYADMPDDRETWHLVLAGLDETAAESYGVASFADAEQVDRERIVARLADGDLRGGSWERLNVSQAWSVCMRMILSGFYSHPWAWNEIGFGGPAYPRGYMRLGPVGTREPFEAPAAGDEDPVSAVREGRV
jgi:gluconate 2-dehydrogenase subunit 3-like protein